MGIAQATLQVAGHAESYQATGGYRSGPGFQALVAELVLNVSRQADAAGVGGDAYGKGFRLVIENAP